MTSACPKDLPGVLELLRGARWHSLRRHMHTILTGGLSLAHPASGKVLTNRNVPNGAEPARRRK
jgi:hypothetical protein